MTEMIDPLDFIAWNMDGRLATEAEKSHWQKSLNKGHYDAYNQCLRFLYGILACLALSNMVYMVLKQMF
jgi:hypothetical protein